MSGGLRLATIGSGRRTHVVLDEPSDKGGLVLCETSGRYRYRDNDGGYSDPDRKSSFHPLPAAGQPTCRRCLAMLSAA